MARIPVCLKMVLKKKGARRQDDRGCVCPQLKRRSGFSLLASTFLLYPTPEELNGKAGLIEPISCWMNLVPGLCFWSGSSLRKQSRRMIVDDPQFEFDDAG